MTFPTGTCVRDNVSYVSKTSLLVDSVVKGAQLDHVADKFGPGILVPNSQQINDKTHDVQYDAIALRKPSGQARCQRR